tara:strand:- start:163 stop:1371 length:1209 start_codon:yes stop_codon:yes gene_type:complete
MSIFTDKGGSIWGDADSIWSQSSMSGAGVGENVFEKLGNSVEEDVLRIRAGGGYPSFPRATPGIPMELTGLGQGSALQEDVFRNPEKYLLGSMGRSDESDESKMREWMGRAEELEASYPKLLAKAKTVASTEFQRKLNVWLSAVDGDGKTPGSRFASVKGDLNDARTQYGNKPWMEYYKGRRNSRIVKMEEYRDDLQNLVDRGLKTFGQDTRKVPQNWPMPTPAPITAEKALEEAQAIYALAKGTGEVAQFEKLLGAAVRAEQVAIRQDKEAVRQKASQLKTIALNMLKQANVPPPIPLPPPGVTAEELLAAAKAAYQRAQQTGIRGDVSKFYGASYAAYDLAVKQGKREVQDEAQTLMNIADKMLARGTETTDSAFPTTYVVLGGAALALGVAAAFAFGKK